MTKSLTPLLFFLSLVPLCATAIAVFFFLPDTIPTHIGAHGIDDYGSKYDAFFIGSLLTACSLLFTLGFYKAESLYAAGLIHGTGVRGGRIMLLCATMLFCIVSGLAILFWMS